MRLQRVDLEHEGDRVAMTWDVDRGPEPIRVDGIGFGLSSEAVPCVEEALLAAVTYLWGPLFVDAAEAAEAGYVCGSFVALRDKLSWVVGEPAAVNGCALDEAD